MPTSPEGTTEQQAKDEIEKGFSAVRWALGVPGAPFFRFRAQAPAAGGDLSRRTKHRHLLHRHGLFRFQLKKPDQVVNAVMTKLKKFGKGIVLMHDFQHATADARLLTQLKANGYKIVLMRAKDPLKTIASYDETVVKDLKLPTVSDRPTSNVVRTISE
jgi:hypothetical protein